MRRELRRKIAAARIGHLATSNGVALGLVPVCFVLLGETLYHAIDAKPKREESRWLARVRNIETNPNAAFLIDHYTEDWRRLWYVLVRGRARILESGDEHRRAILALRRKYPQYRTTYSLARESLVIALDIGAITEWPARRAGAPPRRRPG